MRTLTDDEIERSSHAIAADGPAQHEDELATMAQVAAVVGVPAAILEVLVDPTAPAVARARAWGRAAAGVRRCRSNPGVALVA